MNTGSINTIISAIAMNLVSGFSKYIITVQHKITAMISNIKILKEMTEYEIVKDINNDIIRITRGTECLQ